VSTPISWDELDAAPDADALVFEAPAVVARVEALGDLWADALSTHQALPPLG
jgi:DNA primase